MNKINIILIDIEEDLTWQQCEKYLPLLDEKRKEKCNRVLGEKNKIVSLLSGLIIRKEAGNGNKIELTYNKYGKPYIKDSNLYFSISHSSNLIAYVQANEEIGIDIEEIKEFNMKVSAKFFTEEENSYIEQSKDKNLAAYKIWTAKEAYLKKIGTGFSNGGFKINILDPNIVEKTFTKQIQNHMLSVCCNSKSIAIEIVNSAWVLDFYSSNAPSKASQKLARSPKSPKKSKKSLA